jgi:hypothetical protein
MILNADALDDVIVDKSVSDSDGFDVLSETRLCSKWQWLLNNIKSALRDKERIIICNECR